MNTNAISRLSLLLLFCVHCEAHSSNDSDFHLFWLILFALLADRICMSISFVRFVSRKHEPLTALRLLNFRSIHTNSYKVKTEKKVRRINKNKKWQRVDATKETIKKEKLQTDEDAVWWCFKISNHLQLRNMNKFNIYWKRPRLFMIMTQIIVAFVVYSLLSLRAYCCLFLTNANDFMWASTPLICVYRSNAAWTTSILKILLNKYNLMQWNAFHFYLTWLWMGFES